MNPTSDVVLWVRPARGLRLGTIDIILTRASVLPEGDIAVRYSRRGKPYWGRLNNFAPSLRWL